MKSLSERVQVAIDEAMGFIASVGYTDEYIIEDYPVSFSDRGQCKLAVERDIKRGYRTVRTTCRNGRWAKPKKGVYKFNPTVVVTGDALPDHEAGWLIFGAWYAESIEVEYANRSTYSVLAKPKGLPFSEPDEHASDEVREAYIKWVDGWESALKIAVLAGEEVAAW